MGACPGVDFNKLLAEDAKVFAAMIRPEQGTMEAIRFTITVAFLFLSWMQGKTLPFCILQVMQLATRCVRKQMSISNDDAWRRAEGYA